MKIITLTNQKGGVAKTTSVYNLAAAKALNGKKVLMVDLAADCLTARIPLNVPTPLTA